VFVILVYRPEAETGDPGYAEDPFDGIEILLTCKEEEFANDAVAAQSARHPDWKFHIEQIDAQWFVSELTTVK
jgi:hypothetical protein